MNMSISVYPEVQWEALITTSVIKWLQEIQLRYVTN